MLLRLFKGTGPLVIFLIIITLLCEWISAYLHPAADSISLFVKEPMPLYGLLNEVTAKHQYFGVIISFLMVSLMAFLIVNFNTTDFFINERTFLPAVFYILFGGLFPQYQALNPAIPASLFLIIALRRIMNSYRKQGVAYDFFDAGILIGTGSLFYGNLIWFGLLVFIGIALLRTGNITEIGVSLIGLLTPYIIAFGIYYVIGKDLGDLFSLIKTNLFGSAADYQFSRLTVAALIVAAAITLVSFVHLLTYLNTKKIRSRQTFSLLIWGFLIALTVYIVVPSVSVEIIWIISIPVSYFLANYFVFVRKRFVTEVMFTLFFLIIVLIQIWYLKG